MKKNWWHRPITWGDYIKICLAALAAWTVAAEIWLINFYVGFDNVKEGIRNFGKKIRNCFSKKEKS